MRKLPYLLFITFVFINSVFSQTVIKMSKINGVYQVPCKVNGIPMNFIFDTGASNVTISLTEAKFFLKQGLLTSDDFIESVNYEIANGSIQEGAKIKLKTLEIGGIILKDVIATVVFSQNAPLLLGQTALEKLGKYSISENNIILNQTDINDENKTLCIKEINETFDWILKKIQFYGYTDEKIKKEYFFKLMENKTGAYTIAGNCTTTIGENINKQIFVLPIHKIKNIEFNIDKYESHRIFLTVFANTENEDYPFLVDDEHEGILFNFVLERYLDNEGMQERFVKAFDNLVKYNNLLMDLNNKF